MTKADTVDDETLELALEESRELVPDSDVVAVSAKTGAGLDDLRAALRRCRRGFRRACDRPRATLRRPLLHPPWDRNRRHRHALVQDCGRRRRAPARAVRPRPAREERSGARPKRRAGGCPGQRVALSLPVERRDVRRGDALVAPGAFPLSFRLDVVLAQLAPIADEARLSVHHGAARIPARVARIGDRWAQLRLAEPVVAARGDPRGAPLWDDRRRRHGPPIPRRRGARDPARLERLGGDVAGTIHAPVPPRRIAPRPRRRAGRRGRGFGPVGVRDGLAGAAGGRAPRCDRAQTHSTGVPVPSEPWASDVVPLLGFERRGAKLCPSPARLRRSAREAEAAVLEQRLAEAGFAAVKLDDHELAKFLERHGRLVRLGEEHAIGCTAYEEAKRALVAEATATGEITLGRFRDLIGSGRRDAQLLLEGASTRTASRGASATGASSAGRHVNRDGQDACRRGRDRRGTRAPPTGRAVPEWGRPALRRVEPAGTVHAIFRLGDDLAVRLPRRNGPTEPGGKELDWLPRLAPLLPVEVGPTVAQGAPDEVYAWFWDVYTWVEGDTAPVEEIDAVEAARDLAGLVAAVQQIDPTGAPPGRVPLAERDVEIQYRLTRFEMAIRRWRRSGSVR